jgi:hypothetical protein
MSKEKFMGKRTLLAGILAIVLVFGVVVIGCKKDKTNNNEGVDENGGVFTLINIPSEHNGNYAVLKANNDNVSLIGCQSMNMSARTVAAVRISNGIAVFPMWIKTGENFERYSDNHTIAVGINITDSAEFKVLSDNVNFDTVFFADCNFESVTFSNGSATKSFQ